MTTLEALMEKYPAGTRVWWEAYPGQKKAKGTIQGWEDPRLPKARVRWDGSEEDELVPAGRLRSMEELTVLDDLASL